MIIAGLDWPLVVRLVFGGTVIVYGIWIAIVSHNTFIRIRNPAHDSREIRVQDSDPNLPNLLPPEDFGS